MKKVFLSVILIFASIFTGCASNAYSPQNVGRVETIKYGEILDVRFVKIADDGLGTIGGATVGGLAGSAFGKGKGRSAMIAAGAVLGGLAGNNLNQSDAQELTIRLQNNEEITTVIKTPTNSQSFRVDDKVKVYFSNSKVTRVVLNN